MAQVAGHGVAELFLASGAGGGAVSPDVEAVPFSPLAEQRVILDGMVRVDEIGALEIEMDESVR